MRLPFRADVEGLRAVAILLVVCAHAGVPWLEGGFVGVDVFFVLSGYLITGLLVRELETSGHLNLTAFYARRLQRLLPGLLMTAACTAMASTVLLAPFEQIPQARSLGAAITWTSNFHFAFSNMDYFGPAADTDLFLHTWSLGVEEQFYLLWPALIFFLQRRKSRFQQDLAALMAICMFLSIFLTYVAPPLGFYMVFSRGWQFALGALIFLHFDRNGISDTAPRFASIAGWLGLATILAASLILDSQSPYPGFWALLPSLGTAIVLAAGSATHDSVGANKLLAARPLQGIGRVSYAWYLWHWPTLLLGMTLLDARNPWHVVSLVLLSLAFAVFSYCLVESPLRRSRLLRTRPRTTLLAGIFLMIAGLFASGAWAHLATQWTQSAGQIRFVKVRNDLPAIYRMECDEQYQTIRVHPCLFGDQDAPHTAVLMGDSIAGQWFPAVAKHFDRPGWKLIVLTKSACPMVDKPIFYERLGREYTECEQWRNASIHYLQSLHPDIILFSSVPTYRYSAEDWANGTSRVLADLAIASSHIGIFLPTPILPFDGPACLARQHWRDRVLRIDGSCTAQEPDGQLEMVRAALARAASLHPETRLLDLDAAICPAGRCAAERDGMVVYHDNQHLTATYASTLGDQLTAAMALAGFDPMPPKTRK